jgi:hypothetical protein
MVDLHFSDPVICETCSNTNATRDVSFAVGQTETLMPATVGSFLQPMKVTPTFSLANTFRNITFVTLDANMDIDALGLTAPVNTGFALNDTIPLFSLTLPGFDINTPFTLGIPSITTATQTMDRVGNVAQLLNANVNGLISSETGNPGYDLNFGDQALNTSAFGRLVQAPLQVPGDCGFNCFIDNPCQFFPCDTYFQADGDVIVGNTDLGRLFCITCLSVPGGPQNPFVQDENGVPVFFSDLSDVPDIPTADDILNPASLFYDRILASNEVVENLTTTPGGQITNNPRGTPPLPEPGSLFLVVGGLAALFASRYKLKRGPDEAGGHPTLSGSRHDHQHQ